MADISGVSSGANSLQSILQGRGNTDSRIIHFGANESKEDRMRRIEEITKGNPNVKLDPKAFQDLMKGGDVDVTLNLQAPDRRNLYIGAFASLAQLAGGMGGAAYNDALGSAVLNRVSGDAEYVTKHGNNYKMGLFGGANAQDGTIQVAAAKPREIINPLVNNENIDTQNQVKRLLELQASNITNPLLEQEKDELRTSILRKAQKYSNLSFQEHINKTQDSSVGLSDVHGFEKNNNPYASLLNLGNLEKLGFKTSEAQILAGAANAKTGVVQGINVSKESELSGNTTSLNLEAVLYLQAKAKGSALNGKEIASITKDFNANGTANLVGGKFNVTQESVDQLRSKVAGAKVEAVKDFTTGIFSSLDTEGKAKFLSKLTGKSEEDLKKLSSGELDNLFSKELNGGNAKLFKVFKASEDVYNKNTDGAKIDGLIGRQHILGVQKLVNDRLENLQAASANLTILAGNKPELSAGKSLSNFYNGEFVGDDKKASLIAEYEKRNGPIKATDKWSFMVNKQQEATAKIYNEANGTNLKFEDIATKAVKGELGKEAAQTLRFASREEEKIAGTINGTNSSLSLSKIGANVYGKNNNALGENLKNLSGVIAQNRSNADIIGNGTNIRTIKTGDALTDKVSLTINGTESKGTVAEQAKKVQDALTSGTSVSKSSQDAVLKTLSENLSSQTGGKATSTEIQGFLSGLKEGSDVKKQVDDFLAKKGITSAPPALKANFEAAASLGVQFNISSKDLSVQNTTTANIKKVNDFLSRAGNNTETQVGKARNEVGKIKADLEGQVESLLRQSLPAAEVDKIKAGGKLLSDETVKKIEASVPVEQLAKLKGNITEFNTLNTRLNSITIVSNANAAAQAQASQSNGGNAARQVAGAQGALNNPQNQPAQQSAPTKEQGSEAAKPVAQISGLTGQGAEGKANPQNGAAQAGQGKDDLLDRFLDIGPKAKAPDQLKEVKSLLSEGLSTESISRITGLNAGDIDKVKGEEDRKNLFKMASEGIAKLSNEVAGTMFRVVDQILSRLNKEAAGGFEYGFGHGNGGRITSKIGGAADQDKDEQGNTLISQKSFQNGMEVGNRTKSGFELLTVYNKTREAEARAGSVSVEEGLKRYNANIEKYIESTKPADAADIRSKYRVEVSDATAAEGKKYTATGGTGFVDNIAKPFADAIGATKLKQADTSATEAQQAQGVAQTTNRRSESSTVASGATRQTNQTNGADVG